MHRCTLNQRRSQLPLLAHAREADNVNGVGRSCGVLDTGHTFSNDGMRPFLFQCRMHFNRTHSQKSVRTNVRVIVRAGTARYGRVDGERFRNETAPERTKILRKKEGRERESE